MEKFENGIKLNIKTNNKEKEGVMLFENYALDLSDMMPVANLDEAIEAGASFPDNFFKLISINQDACEITFSGDEEVYKIKLGGTLNKENILVKLIGVRFNAEKFDDWKTI